MIIDDYCRIVEACCENLFLDFIEKLLGAFSHALKPRNPWIVTNYMSWWI